MVSMKVSVKLSKKEKKSDRSAICHTTALSEGVVKKVLGQKKVHYCLSIVYQWKKCSDG